jgi:UDP-N-acetylglucosamine 2-epimerase (non-hydrolysing)
LEFRVRAERPRFHIASIVGTRPEAIKMAPVVRAIAARRGLSQQLVLTRQHSGLAPMFDGVAPEAIRELPYDPRGHTVARLRETLHRLLCGHFRREPADLVLVHGDTASALAGALAARDCGFPVGHVEAGLRSGDLRQPWPEEGNRMAVDVLSALLFAPTAEAAQNLEKDWRVDGQVFVTGNTGIDALFHALRTVRPSPPPGRPLIVATCHRKENQGAPLERVCAALRRIACELPVDIDYLLHLNRHLRAAVRTLLADAPGIRLVEPLDYGEMVRLLDRSWLILTDSGGLQEEGPALGKPVLVLRNVTERPEGLASANIELVGTDPGRIFGRVKALCGDPDQYARMSRPSFPFGDGHAAPRIVDSIAAWSARRGQSISRDAVPRFAKHKLKVTVP